MELFGCTDISYYYKCVAELKHRFGESFTLFVFSDDLDYARDNLHFDVPTEFVERCRRDADEIFLMSQCRHHIIANSTFSWWGAWLNPNPDKKVFAPDKWFRHPRGHSEIIPESWLKMPVDLNKVPNMDITPGLSIVIYIDNNISAVKDTLACLPAKKLFYCEFILLDDSMNDEIGALCQKAAHKRKDIRSCKFNRKIGRGATWNIGLAMATGDFVLFLKSGELIATDNILNSVLNFHFQNSDILHFVQYGIAAPNGQITLQNRQFTRRIDTPFQNPQQLAQLAFMPKLNFTGLQYAEILSTQQFNRQLGTKIFRRTFLLGNHICFNEKLDSGLELLFLLECLLQTNSLCLTPQLLYFERHEHNDFSDWKADFHRFSDELERLLHSIDNKNARRKLALHLSKQYWQDV